MLWTRIQCSLCVPQLCPLQPGDPLEREKSPPLMCVTDLPLPVWPEGIWKGSQAQASVSGPSRITSCGCPKYPTGITGNERPIYELAKACLAKYPGTPEPFVEPGSGSKMAISKKKKNQTHVTMLLLWIIWQQRFDRCLWSNPSLNVGTIRHRILSQPQCSKFGG